MKLRLILSILFAAALVAASCGSDESTEADGEGSAEEGADENTVESTEEGAGEGTDEGTEDTGDNTEGAAACDAPPTKVDGTLTVATGEPVFPPWMQDDDPSNGQGYESALVYAVASEMGIENVEWVRTGFDAAIAPGEKDYDFNIQQYSISDTRDEVVDFSTGYYQVEQAIIGLADSPAASASSLADLTELRLGAAIGTTSLDYIEDVIQPSNAAAVYDDNAAAKAAFEAGQVDAIVFDLPTAYFITAVEIPEASIIGVLPRSDSPEELGMLFEDGSPLVPCVDAALAALSASETLAALEEEWLNDGGSIPTISK